VWSLGPGDTYILNDRFRGSLVHWDGIRWTEEAAVPLSAAHAIWASGRNDVVVVGDKGTTARWDGKGWSTPPVVVPVNLRNIHGSSSGDVFATGDGCVLHRRGATWQPIRLPAQGYDADAWATPTRVFFVGNSGGLLLDRTWTACGGVERACFDGWDDDCDGSIDGADADCAGRVAEQCTDLVDDDGDGKIDCADPDCAAFPSCKGRP
jgi:hypothetical protein